MGAAYVALRMRLVESALNPLPGQPVDCLLTASSTILNVREEGDRPLHLIERGDANAASRSVLEAREWLA